MSFCMEGFAEMLKDGVWTKISNPNQRTGSDQTDYPFYNDQDPALNRLLCGWENSGAVLGIPVIQKPTEQLPEGCTMDAAKYGEDEFNLNSLTLRQLLDFDYDQVVKSDLPAYGFFEPQPDQIVLRERLGASYFEALNNLSALGSPENIRVILWIQ